MPPDANLQKFVLTAKSGLIKSTFYHPGNTSATKPTVALGAVLQDAKVARGYFVGTNQTGSMRLQRK
jgi:hypothetical protein